MHRLADRRWWTPGWSHYGGKGGPITGGRVVPCCCRNSAQGGPILVAGDMLTQSWTNSGRSVRPLRYETPCAHGADGVCSRTTPPSTRFSSNSERNEEPFKPSRPINRRWTPMPTSTTTKELRRLICTDLSRLAPVRKRPENGGESDRSGRDQGRTRALRRQPSDEGLCLTPGFSGRSS